MPNYAKPAASGSLKETRDKDSSLAAALKAAVLNQVPRKRAILCQIMQSRPLPILSKRPEIRIPAWRQLSKRRFSTRCSLKTCHFMPNYAKPAASDSLEKTRDKDSSLAAALKATVFNEMP